ncbi:MAG: BrnT family toxin [Betaproteobacteria bacterium]|nr:BrnT family toxin [Betaproteobacteria bacterium]
MEIEFDLGKAAANPLNHTQGEARFVTLGRGGKGRILLVVWTLRGETPRLISAWKANQPQRRRYEQQF